MKSSGDECNSLHSAKKGVRGFCEPGLSVVSPAAENPASLATGGARWGLAGLPASAWLLPDPLSAQRQDSLSSHLLSHALPWIYPAKASRTQFQPFTLTYNVPQDVTSTSATHPGLLPLPSALPSSHSQHTGFPSFFELVKHILPLEL